MKGRLVAFDTFRGREAAALVVDGRLEDLLVAGPDDAPPGPGAVFRGIADRPMKGMGGIFVKLPDGQTGYLKETAGIVPGRPLILQATGWPEPGKALPVTTRVLFKGRHAIVTPGAPGLNVSRRIRDGGTRARLTALAEAGMAGSEHGLIIRSAAEAAEDHAVAEDIAAMRMLADQILADVTGGPELLLDAPSPQEEAWRDWSDPAPDEVDADEGSFERHGIDEMIGRVLISEVELTGGGRMAIEPTRALVAVDVNTGGDGSPSAGLKANIAAARDLARQLRLRGLGGQIAVDFAPMPKKDRAALEQQLRAAFRGDATETVLAGWTPLGNFELQRKRDRMPLAQILKGTR
jgi:Ribonuclease G/E